MPPVMPCEKPRMIWKMPDTISQAATRMAMTTIVAPGQTRAMMPTTRLVMPRKSRTPQCLPIAPMPPS